jgi:Uma2 family endonuclease
MPATPEELHYAWNKGDGMATEVTKRLFTADEFYKMVEAGILTKYDHVELIDGEIIQMSPTGYRHVVCVDRAMLNFFEAFGRRAVISSQSGLPLSDLTVPQPDVIVYKPRADLYAAKKRTAADVLFIVEVADSSLAFDQKVKLPRFAAAGISEYWIEDLQHDLLLIHREPRGTTYDTVITLRPGDFISPAAFPDVKFSVEELLSTDCIE